MTIPEKAWLLINIRKDQEEQFEIVKHLGMLINPSAFLDNKDKISTSNSIEDELAAKTGLGSEEISRILTDSTEDLEFLDTIEPIR